MPSKVVKKARLAEISQYSKLAMNNAGDLFTLVALYLPVPKFK
jgi:hypothetical protein